MPRSLLELLVTEDVDEGVDCAVGKDKPFTGELKIRIGINGHIQVDQQPIDLFVKRMDTVVGWVYFLYKCEGLRDRGEPYLSLT